jgi:hypothetical protein
MVKNEPFLKLVIAIHRFVALQGFHLQQGNTLLMLMFGIYGTAFLTTKTFRLCRE